jgi:hypothetical protein
LREYTVLSRLGAYNQWISSHASKLGSQPGRPEQQEDREEDVEGWLVPVPRTYNYYPGDNKNKDKPESQGEKVGMPEFYTMEFKEGKVFEDCEFPELDSEVEKAEWYVLRLDKNEFSRSERLMIDSLAAGDKPSGPSPSSPPCLSTSSPFPRLSGLPHTSPYRSTNVKSKASYASARLRGLPRSPLTCVST